MRKSDAIYGGEMSAHHYFKDFAFCDSGMVPWLLVWELISTSQKSLKNIVDDRRKYFLSSGEINFTVNNPVECLASVKALYNEKALSQDEIDGVSMSFEDWRFNLRRSNTEALIRVNVETTRNEEFLNEKVNEITELLERFNC